MHFWKLQMLERNSQILCIYLWINLMYSQIFKLYLWNLFVYLQIHFIFAKYFCEFTNPFRICKTFFLSLQIFFVFVECVLYLQITHLHTDCWSVHTNTFETFWSPYKYNYSRTTEAEWAEEQTDLQWHFYLFPLRV